MIKLTDIDGKPFYLAPAAILQINDASVSTSHRGIGAIIRTRDQRFVEVREKADQVVKAMQEPLL